MSKLPSDLSSCRRTIGHDPIEETRDGTHPDGLSRHLWKLRAWICFHGNSQGPDS
ncbi:hypothetical protein RESH_04152 [Rhodopirellula europaea SH398]|uniref:Uncharacterized protein n=1 Tax=Rhodopirellula europaea SH398 TaxID=1263868 RepID=M5S1F8_9BACT|nr:hypothetical protein RESH_04152 [Rhodopirellula europaea SH398]